MKHRYSLAHLTVLSLSPPQVIDAAARAGYDYASLRMTRVTTSEPSYDLACDRPLMRETKARMRDTGIGVHDTELFRMDASTEAEQYVPQLEATAELGAQQIIAQLPDPDRARAVDRFARLCELAKPFRIVVNLEFPHWTETGDLAEAARVIRRADRDNAGILVDMLHMGRSHSSVDELAALPREWFHFAHVCDAEHHVPDNLGEIIHTARDERLFPGEGTIDVHGILARMPSGIVYSLEIPRTALTKAVGPEEVARLALKVARTHLDSEESDPIENTATAQPAIVIGRTDH